ncbi:MAG: GTPase ObgE [bacterium]|nr:GTPase ObgE [bacterium]
MNFIDEADLHVCGGRGGNGCMAFRREKSVPKGGPSGGDGGRGGSVLLVGDSGMNTLYPLRHQRLYAAKRGQHGEGSNKTGRSAEDLRIKVPLGTQVLDAGGSLLGEVLRHGEELCVAKGGDGGRGNARFATSTNRAPRRSEPGYEGEERDIHLQLKLLADVGVIGLPNAGKSTFIRTVSAARPKVADYPFTTLVPNLGVVDGGYDRQPFVIADLPGLIEGAADGAGLGHRFLRHIERCRILLHFVDLSTGEASSVADLEVLEKELGAYAAELLERPRWIVGTKLDAAVEERRGELAAAAQARNLPYYEISSAARLGTAELIGGLESVLARLDT